MIEHTIMDLGNRCFLLGRTQSLIVQVKISSPLVEDFHVSPKKGQRMTISLYPISQLPIACRAVFLPSGSSTFPNS